MVNIGMDFGSTYTLVSVYTKDGLKTVQPNGNSYYYPSIVSYNEARKKYAYGSAALSDIGNSKANTFRGFKMLLNQQMSQENLESRGYRGENTPEKITEIFIRKVIEQTLKNLGEDKVDTLVLGAPECWFQSLNTIDARGTLREICNNMSDIVNHVKIISEPTNAAAFCIWKYEQNNGKQFNGHILVIDYGGGTLDTALVKISHENNALQIKPEMRSGAGENSENQIGKAGIAYQEGVVKRAIHEALDIAEDEIPFDSQFHSAVSQFERSLITATEDVKEIISEYSQCPEDLVDEYFTTLSYKGEDVNVNFFHLYQIYQEIISDTLHKVLEETTSNISVDSEIMLALVGGFSNLFMVMQQTFDYFKIGNIGQKSIQLTEEEREKAVAHGAALFAENELSLRNVAAFSIGMYACYPNGKLFNHYAINYGQEVVPGKVYFATDFNDTPFVMLASHIDTFLLNLTCDETKGFPVHPIQEFSKNLQNVEHTVAVVIGFSLDAAEHISVHVYNYDIGQGKIITKPAAIIPLGTLQNSFENTVIIRKEK